MPSGFKTITQSKSSPIPTLVRQMDELQRISSDYKREQLGEDWFRDVRDFFSLQTMQATAPSFRPRVIVPELQMYMLAEAGDVTDNSPVIYITEREHGRDKAREQAMRGAWRQGQFNIQLFLAQLWANLGGTGIAMVGFDPWARGGRGETWLKVCDPGNCYPDPAASSEDDWEYFVLVEKKYLDWVQARFPEQGYRIEARPSTHTPGSGDTTLGMPFGPMMSPGGLPEQYTGMSDGQVSFRRSWTNDTTIEKVRDLAGSAAGKELDIAPSKYRKMFPNGRLTMDAEGTILFDGDNYVPHRQFPFVRFWGMPSLQGFWGVPPIRYTRSLQELAERMYTQVFENAIRLNNGWILIPNTTGIDADKFGGLPGEITVYDAMQGHKPEVVWPKEMPAHMAQLPQLLLEEQRRVQGHTEARQGNPGAGNVSEDLYEAAVGQASKITKIRGRFFAASVQRAAELVFYFMARFHKNALQFPPAEKGSEELTQWKPIDGESLYYDVWLDEGSIEPMSQQNLRKTALALKQAGLYDIESTLEALGLPNAKEIAEKVTQQLQLEALANVKSPGRKQR